MLYYTILYYTILYYDIHQYLITILQWLLLIASHRIISRKTSELCSASHRIASHRVTTHRVTSVIWRVLRCLALACNTNDKHGNY